MRSCGWTSSRGRPPPPQPPWKRAQNWRGQRSKHQSALELKILQLNILHPLIHPGRKGRNSHASASGLRADQLPRIRIFFLQEEDQASCTTAFPHGVSCRGRRTCRTTPKLFTAVLRHVTESRGFVTERS